MIRVSKVLNPFEPTNREEREVPLADGEVRYVDDALREAGVDPERYRVVIDGGVVPIELAASTRVHSCTHIIAMPHVGGGGGFWKTFAEIAVLAIAAVVTFGLSSVGTFGLLFASAGLGNLSGAAVSLISAGIVLGGNLLINAFLSPSLKGGQDSATYDPVGPRTTAQGGIPIPKGYGTVRWGGNIIASNFDAEGQDNYINVLVCFGWGPAKSITDIRINGTPIADYKQVTYQMRLGTNDQEPIPYFNNIKNGYPQAVRCLMGEPVIVQGNGTATQGLEVTVQFPSGVFFSNDDGSLRSLSIAYKVEYAVSGTGNWQVPTIPRNTHDIVTFHQDGTVAVYPVWVVIPNDTAYSAGIVYSTDSDPSAHYPGEPWTRTQTVHYYNADGGHYDSPITLHGEWQRCDPNLNQQAVDDWSAGYVIFTDQNQAALYNVTRIYNLPPNKYDVRVTKYGSAFTGDSIQPREANNPRTGDQIWLHNISEVQYQDLAYPNMILLGVRALASNQLSGGNMNITAVISHGIQATLPVALASYETDNPAVVTYDMMCSDSELYGGGIDASQMTSPDLVVWADSNDQLVSDGFTGQIKRHVFNGVFEQSNTNLWKCVQRVGMMSQCIPVQTGKRYGFILDGPVDAPVQVFTVGNIKKDSLKDVWMSLDDRANRVEVTFADAGRDYRTDEPCAVMTPSDIAAGADIQNTRVDLLGCTSRPQAWHWAYRKLLSTKSLVLTRSFDTNLEAIACRIGSVIGVQDDITRWADGGRVQPGSTSASLLLDRRDLAFAVGQGWTVSVVHPLVLRGACTVQTVNGSQVTTTAPLPPGRILRASRPGGAEFVVQQYGGSALLLTSVGVQVGDVLSLYDQDVIDTQVVAALAGAVLTPAAPFIQPPAADAPWVYGQSAGAFPAKLFRVTNIRRKGDFDMTVDTVQYDPSVYADDTPVIVETLGVPDAQAAVTSLVLSENYSTANGGNAGILSTVNVGWQNGRDTVRTELWIARNEVGQPISTESLLATVSKGTTYSFSAATGAIIQIRAVGVDAKNITSSWATAPVATITVQGAGAAPGDITTLAGDTTVAGTTLTWMPPAGAASYEVRYNFDIANSNWNTGVLLWAGTATTWMDSLYRTGRYMVKALSATSVESINAATYSYLESGSRLNSVGFAPGQAISVLLTENAANPTGGKCSAILTCPAQTLLRVDGSAAQTPASAIGWTTLEPQTTYTVYTYLDIAVLKLHSGAGDTTIPDTETNPASAAACAANGCYPGPVIKFTTPGSSTVTRIAASLNVETQYIYTIGYDQQPYYRVTGVTVASGGGGYVRPVGQLVGQATNNSVPPQYADVALTVGPGGAITGAQCSDGTMWLRPPSVQVTDSGS